MAQQLSFGRRGAAQPPARPAYAVDASSPQLEAFRASLKDAGHPEDAQFAQWRRTQRPRRILLIAVGLAFMAPGLFCFLFQAPWWLSLGLEAGGLGANGWLRRERLRQAKEIAGWTPSSKA